MTISVNGCKLLARSNYSINNDYHPFTLLTHILFSDYLSNPKKLGKEQLVYVEGSRGYRFFPLT